ncbi:LysR family transcriptional regulator [Streptomyces tsukubensis]|uniref:LysR family transcriptional regulator n=1 Tax=Streptomyces tsukubensis TaxID=83656 RepID=A0A1V4A5U1_9ACTN|nr:LysR family transcriptional regulator [Streptomyces tsukubensis]OON76979.1 LysR family transcriptional regulator [Streptomyces tsukubensis]QFR93783.1 LysR family transcriptional regulator [Streptomyces tsukubensis]
MISFDRLRALAAVSAHGSIARAAEALHITPSGLSQQLAKLEREAGHRLLEPRGRSVRITHAGRVLAAHADRMLSELASTEADLRDLHDEVLGPLRIGGVGSAVRTLLPEALESLAAAHPRLRPTVADGEAVDLVPRLLDGQLDLLLIESWANRPLFVPEGVTLRTVVSEEVWVALSVRHPLNGRGTIDLTELKGTAWASCPPGTEPHEALVQAARAQGVEPDVRYTLTDHITQLALVEKNLTAALMPAMSHHLAPHGVHFARLRPALRRDIKAAWTTSAETPPVRACVALLGGGEEY